MAITGLVDLGLDFLFIVLILEWIRDVFYLGWCYFRLDLSVKQINAYGLWGLSFYLFIFLTISI